MTHSSRTANHGQAPFGTPHPAFERPASDDVLKGLTALWSRVERMVQVAGERRKLARLDARALADIGVSRSEAIAEAARPMWDLPNAPRQGFGRRP